MIELVSGIAYTPELDAALYGLRNLAEDELDKIGDAVLDLPAGELRSKIEALIAEGKLEAAYEEFLRPTLEKIDKQVLLSAAILFARDFITDEDIAAAPKDKYRELLVVELVEALIEEHEALLTTWWKPSKRSDEETMRLCLLEQEAELPEHVDTSKLCKMNAFIRHAQDLGVARPSMTVLAPDLKTLKLSLVPRTSAFPEGIEVKHGSSIVGTILPNGFVFGALSKTPVFLQLICEVADFPAKAAKIYAEMFGSCSFCGRDLTRDEFKQFGFHKHCGTAFSVPSDEDEAEENGNLL